ncbi:hypothetical protein [Chryseobacterium sp. JUb7]|uniref:hypothetical protein n=1 Tax=Chryseobacterium sp. JUb7 TaxID=2940599 RepID=UPI002167CE90|nr:hypothetical protein [Chryseobacterium sp. JUb7]MCS3529896.1 hypothetical protein [Chryseobacterium sp. JUb7]
MKKFISFKIIALGFLALSLQSCRQDDENNLSNFEENSINNKNTEQQITSRDTLKNPESGYEDPPVKNGTHWKNNK